MKLYGLLHDKSGKSSVRPPRSLKVSIGLPVGPDVHVFISPLGKWTVKVAGKTTAYALRREAEAAYAEAAKTAPARKFPSKLPYFTFTEPAADGSQTPEFGAIEACGPIPTQLDIVLSGMADDIFDAAQEMWRRGALLCRGDGIDANRSVSMAATEEEKAYVAAHPNARTFPIVDGCRASTRGCPYSVGAGNDPPACKPKCDLRFQLAAYPLIGGEASYSSTSHKTIKAIGVVVEKTAEQLGEPLQVECQIYVRQYMAKTGKAWYVGLRPRGFSSSATAQAADAGIEEADDEQPE